MRKIIKEILISLGLLNVARKIYRYISSKRSYPDVWFLNRGSVQLKYLTRDPYAKKWFYPRYMGGRIHEPSATELFFKHINSNSQVLDIGGHLGYFTCIAAKLAHQGTVDVFEVDPKCLDFITKNLAANDIQNVTVNNFAVSDEIGKITIPKSVNPNPSLNISAKLSKNYIEIQSITIDEFIRKKGLNPDFVKIDVEGAELKVLRGMKHLLTNDHLTLLIEIHVEKLANHFNSDYRDCIDILQDNGFSIENIEHRSARGKFKEVSRNTKLEGNTMLLCKKL